MAGQIGAYEVFADPTGFRARTPVRSEDVGDKIA
jgi:hypothetical protein